MIDRPSILKDLDPERIKRNPENPRLFFRPEEMDTLMASIRRYGIQVPVTVYQKGNDYILLDGERRWRSALKLNLKRVPALVQPEPSPLENLLLMFNIHALREQWDYLTIANKLPAVIEKHIAENGWSPNEIELSEITGLTRGQIRRCRYLLDLPPKYRKELEEELGKPKSLQVLSEDFFIEMERALKTVQSRVPAAIGDLNQARDTLIEKFRSDVIGNITDFRMLSKIATSIDNLGVREGNARNALVKILSPQNNVGISQVFSEQFEVRYDDKKFTRNVESIFSYLAAYEDAHGDLEISPDVADKLKELSDLIDRVLGE